MNTNDAGHGSRIERIARQGKIGHNIVLNQKIPPQKLATCPTTFLLGVRKNPPGALGRNLNVEVLKAMSLQCLSCLF